MSDLASFDFKKKTDRGYHCQIHMDGPGCGEPYETRRSVYGAVTRGCYRAWHSPIETPFGKKLPKVDLKLWPEVIA